LRVLLIANTLPHTDISGVGEQVVQLAAGLESLGHEVRVLSRGPGGAPGPKLLFPLTVVPVFLWEIKKFRPHVIQVHESDGGLVALVARTLAAMLDPQPRLVALLQVSYLEEIRAVRPLREEGLVLGRPGLREISFRWLKAPLQVVLGLMTAWLADEVLAPSQQTAHEIERDYAVSEVQVLPNVTGARQLVATGETDLPEPGYLLFVGRLRIRKGVEVLLHTIDRLRQQYPRIRLVVVGGGEHRSRLESVVEELDLGSQVEFVGPCPAERVPALMSGALAMVVPSIYEGMPLVILEAMAAALPVVASRVSGIPEVVEDGRSGWLVAPESIDELAVALAEVHDDPQEARRRGQEGKLLVAASATPAEAARRWSDLVLSRQPSVET